MSFWLDLNITKEFLFSKMFLLIPCLCVSSPDPQYGDYKTVMLIKVSDLSRLVFAINHTATVYFSQLTPLCSSDGSLQEETSSVGRDSQSDDENAPPSNTNTPTDQTETFLHDESHNNLELRPEVSEAALQDG